jgi:DNA adenine methylase
MSISTAELSKSHPVVEVRPPAPFLKWAGGKGQLLGQMSPYFPSEYRTYFEPFLGGGAVFFHLRPEKAVLADLNPDLVNAFQVVRDHPTALMKALDQHSELRTCKEYFYEVRGQEISKLSPVERAARMVFLNKTCYNGLFRVNSRGGFNVPWGGYSNPTLYERATLLSASALLQGKKVVLEGYRKACARARKGDLVYFDPPYHPLSETSGFTSYTKEDFGDEEQEALAETFRTLDNRGCLVMLSNSPTSLVRSLYGGFRSETLRAKRAINSKGTGRGAVDELLILNY